MPLAPLPEPASFGARILGQIKGWVAFIPLFLALMVCNFLQMGSLVIWPFSKRAFRRANREIANTWWSMCDLWAEHWWKIDVQFSGDDIPRLENALVISNHQSMADITTLFRLARQKGRLGDLKWFVKDVLKYVPGVGWGMVFLDCIFLKRDWKSDRDSVNRALGKFASQKIPIWTISFAEGTRVGPHKLKKSQDYAREQGHPVLNHLLLPRTKGFTASVQGLREHLDAIYDATIAYENGVPTAWQWAKGYVHRVNVHVVRHPMASLPDDDEGLKQWLMERYQEKDARLDAYYKTGALG